MVKLLRRCLREVLTRTSALVDQGARLERDMATNVSRAAPGGGGCFRARSGAPSSPPRAPASRTRSCLPLAVLTTAPRPPPALQAESVHLDAGSVQRRLEADAALARKEAAQMQARYKAERAQWVAEVDMQKIEVGAAGTGLGRGAGVSALARPPPQARQIAWRLARAAPPGCLLPAHMSGPS
jgi:hypothetical protein